MDCVTPSHPQSIPPGESLDILQLLEKGDEAYLDPAEVPHAPPRPERFEYVPRRPVMESLQTPNDVVYLQAQIASTPEELTQIVKDLKKPTPKKKQSENDDEGSSGPPASRSRPRGRPRKQKSVLEAGPMRKYTQAARLNPINDFRDLYDWANTDHMLSRTWGNTTDLGLPMIRRLPVAPAMGAKAAVPGR